MESPLVWFLAAARFRSTGALRISARTPIFWLRLPTQCSMSGAKDYCALRWNCPWSMKIGRCPPDRASWLKPRRQSALERGHVVT
jgi:hypothetical protein